MDVKTCGRVVKTCGYRNEAIGAFAAPCYHNAPLCSLGKVGDFFFPLLKKKKRKRWISEYLGRIFTEGTGLSSVCAVMQRKECLGEKKMPVLNTIYL